MRELRMVDRKKGKDNDSSMVYFPFIILQKEDNLLLERIRKSASKLIRKVANDSSRASSFLIIAGL